MTTYRLYVISHGRQRAEFTKIECTNDAVAFEIAKDMARSGTVIEIWSGNRFVGEVRPGPA